MIARYACVLRRWRPGRLLANVSGNLPEHPLVARSQTRFHYGVSGAFTS
jgi:hypothetical protein